MEPLKIIEYIIADLGLDEFKVRGVLSLLAKGATVPFIARYRKEETGSLDEVQIRAIGDKFAYYAELESSKIEIMKSIESGGGMTDELKERLAACKQKYVLEDLYAPYKPHVRTRATIARESGLEPLAEAILHDQPSAGNKKAIAAGFVNAAKNVPIPEAAIEGAIEIIVERISENADVRTRLRGLCGDKGVLISKVIYELAGAKTKYETYYNFSQLLSKVPSHRMLAIRRGAREKVLYWEIEPPNGEPVKLIESMLVNNKRSVFYVELLRAIDTAYNRTLKLSIAVEAFRIKAEEAERDAIVVFAKNLRNLLLAPPAGNKVIIGVDPGIATGAKLAVIDGSGSFLEHRQIFLHGSERLKLDAERSLAELAAKHGAELIAIGNGTGSKETYAFIDRVVKARGLGAKPLVISEAGASVYSASDAARAEFPDLDVTIRGAISIARRLQDPLADLVKIDPKSIGVGQYQHDVNQALLKKELDATVESCVNHVGVELNTASFELLTHISGIGRTAASGIVSYRKRKGPFTEKRELLKVPMMNGKIFEQCAGFLKIREGAYPLDNSTIHPERYELVERMASDLGVDVARLIGNRELVSKIDPKRYISDDAGLPTITDIVKELEKPGVDPRKEFDSAEVSASINELDDLSPGMLMNGVVTNVTDFGAFVDIGVHQDGLMHISRMSDRFVKDPHEILSVGDRIKVKIVSIDKALDRISLEMHR
ncbi:MAG: Tex family protein [Candidatus Omnitrophota bacterium]